jgi:peroxiredoxin
MIMSKDMHYLITTFFILLFSHAVLPAEANLLLEDIEGNKYSLSDYIGKGKWVVVNIWGTDCPYCRQELDALSDFNEQHHDKDAIVIGLTLHWPSFGFPDKEALYYFALDYFIEYPLLMVDAELASKVIGKPVNMIPLTFFYEPDGELVLRINGVVTNKDLEKVIKGQTTHYQVQWTKDIPPEFKPE